MGSVAHAAEDRPGPWAGCRHGTEQDGMARRAGRTLNAAPRTVAPQPRTRRSRQTGTATAVASWREAC